MQRFVMSLFKNRSCTRPQNNQTQLIKASASEDPPRPPPPPPRPPPFDIFISYRAIDTKRTISGLLHDHFSRLGFNTFLDRTKMKPGDRLADRIDDAIVNCKIGLVVFSPNYCDSHFCLHELALILECKKRIVPVFCDVKPSQLCVRDDIRQCPPSEIRRFRRALEEAKYTVGIPFDTSEGDWSEFLTVTTDAVMKNLLELEEQENPSTKNKLSLPNDSMIFKYISFT